MMFHCFTVLFCIRYSVFKINNLIFPFLNAHDIISANL